MYSVEKDSDGLRRRAKRVFSKLRPHELIENTDQHLFAAISDQVSGAEISDAILLFYSETKCWTCLTIHAVFCRSGEHVEKINLHEVTQTYELIEDAKGVKDSIRFAKLSPSGKILSAPTAEQLFLLLNVLSSVMRKNIA